MCIRDSLVGVLLIGASIYFAYDQNKGKLPGKSVGGEDVVFSIGDQDITAGEFYDTLFNEMGVAGVYQFMEKAVVDPSIETTEEMKTQAQSYEMCIRDSRRSRRSPSVFLPH